MIAIASDKIQIVDILLDANVDIDLEDTNSDTVVTIAKKFNNKLGQHRLAQFKWKKRTEEELKNKKEAKQTEDKPVFTETRLPHQVFDSSKRTWFKGDFMQVYMAHLVPPDEYSGTNFSAPKSVGIAGLFISFSIIILYLDASKIFNACYKLKIFIKIHIKVHLILLAFRAHCLIIFILNYLKNKIIILILI